MAQQPEIKMLGGLGSLMGYRYQIIINGQSIGYFYPTSSDETVQSFAKIINAKVEHE